MINKKLIIGVFTGNATGILLSFVIFLNVTLYRFGHVVNYFNSLLPSSNQADTLPSTEVGSSNENELIFPNELTTWLTDNVANTGIGFSVSAEAFSRPNSDVANEDISYDLNNLDVEIANQRDFMITSLNLDSPERNASLNIGLNDTISQSFNGAEYEIEVFSWEAYPAFLSLLLFISHSMLTKNNCLPYLFQQDAPYILHGMMQVQV